MNSLTLGIDGFTADDVHSLMTYWKGLVDRRAAGSRRDDIARTAESLAQHPTMQTAAPAPAPTAAPLPSTAPATVTPAVSPALSAAAGTLTDVKGVPWHPDFHSGKATDPGRNDDGTWKMRRGHDKAAAKAYEAQFKGNASAAGQPAPLTVAPMVNTATVGAPLPPPPGVPAQIETEALWLRLVRLGRASAELEAWIIANMGGHPTSDLFRNDALKRVALMDLLRQYDVADAA